MSSFANDDAAAAALAAANAEDITPADAALEQAAVAPVVTTPVEGGTNSDGESFTNIDINSLPPELRDAVAEAIKPFQADYTRKTQEVAPVRQIMQDTGMSAEEARQALEFVQGLSNPENVRELYDTLQAQFAADNGADDDADDLDGVDPRDRKMEELSGRLATFEQQQALNAARLELDSTVASIREAHPDYKDADIERVQKLAVAQMQNGVSDLKKAMTAANTEYQSWRGEMLNDYIAGKGKVQAGGTPLINTPHAQTPEKFANLDEATKAALAHFGQEF